MGFTIDETLDAIDSLDFSEQELVYDVFSKRLIEARRLSLRKNADETLNAVENGEASSGSIEDLFKELESRV